MGFNNSGGIELLEETDTRINVAPRYNVMMHNDNKSTMEFVVDVLKKIFGKNTEEAVTLMMKVHHEGVALVATYPSFEYAELKVDQVHSLARTQKFPLTCTIEEA
jgi:ATP-dependent Clp protease adaptor protein ClpS